VLVKILYSTRSVHNLKELQCRNVNYYRTKRDKNPVHESEKFVKMNPNPHNKTIKKTHGYRIKRATTISPPADHCGGGGCFLFSPEELNYQIKTIH
jgi:hypothetical protein